MKNNPSHPPWLLQGEAFILNYWFSPKMLKLAHTFDLSFSRFGRVVQVILTRYKDTPIGAFDELFIMDHPLISKRCLSTIPRMLVSTPSAIPLMQQYWGVPKIYAQFEWEHHDSVTHCRIHYQQQEMQLSIKRSKNAKAVYINSHHLPKAMLTIGQHHAGQDFQFTPQFRGKISKIQRAEWFNTQNIFPDFSQARYLQSFYTPSFQLLLPEAKIKEVTAAMFHVEHP